MTKQEEIRGLVEFEICSSINGDRENCEKTVCEGCSFKLPRLTEATDAVFSYLHSQGVVIKVKCSDCEWSQFVDEEIVGMTPCHSCNSTGYLIEPLIKEA